MSTLQRFLVEKQTPLRPVPKKHNNKRAKERGGKAQVTAGHQPPGHRALADCCLGKALVFLFYIVCLWVCRNAGPATPLEGSAVHHVVTTPPPGSQAYAAAAGALHNSNAGERSLQHNLAHCTFTLWRRSTRVRSQGTGASLKCFDWCVQ